MKRTYSGSFKACATCSHWFGNRESQLGGKLVAAEHDARGACNHPARVGMTNMAFESCGRWVKLESLR